MQADDVGRGQRLPPLWTLGWENYADQEELVFDAVAFISSRENVEKHPDYTRQIIELLDKTHLSPEDEKSVQAATSTLRQVFPHLFNQSWKLGNQDFGDIRTAPAAILRHLAEHRELLDSREVKRLIIRIESLDLSQATMDNEAWEARAELMKARPQLFTDVMGPKVKLQAGQETLEVFKNNLLMRSEPFRKIFALELDKTTLEIEAEQAFAHFINMGTLTDVEDTFALLQLADQYDVKDLKTSLEKLIKEEITNDNVFEILEAAQATQSKSLEIACLIHIFKSDLPSNSVPADRKALFNLLQQIKTEGGTLIETPEGLIDLSFKRWDQEDHSSVINDLCKIADVRLRLENTPHDDASFKTFMQNLPELNHIFIRNNTLKKLEGLDNIKSIDCSHCPGLTSFDAPKATRVDCSDCYALTGFDAPEATTLNCSRCHALTRFDAPKATRVDCICCNALTHFDAPKAESVNCSYCQVLTRFNAPEATTLNCSNCRDLTSFDAPKATRVDCSDCPALTRFNAPEATWLNCSDCRDLTHVDAPKAITFFCSCCGALTRFDAPKATKVYCSYCPKLKDYTVGKNCVMITQ